MRKYYFLLMLCSFLMGFGQQWHYLDRINDCTYYVKEPLPSDKKNEIWYKMANCSKGVSYFDEKSKSEKIIINGYGLTLELFDCDAKKIGYKKSLIYSSNGNVLSQSEVKYPNIIDVVPDSVGESLLNILCAWINNGEKRHAFINYYNAENNEGFISYNVWLENHTKSFEELKEFYQRYRILNNKYNISESDFINSYYSSEWGDVSILSKYKRTEEIHEEDENDYQARLSAYCEGFFNGYEDSFCKKNPKCNLKILKVKCPEQIVLATEEEHFKEKGFTSSDNEKGYRDGYRDGENRRFKNQK